MIVDLVLLAWIPIGIGLFLALPARTAILTSFVVGWLFLPIGRFRVEGLPDVNKSLAISITCFCAALVFDMAAYRRWRPRWADAPVLAMALAPIASSLSNELGLWDGFSASMSVVAGWLLPYLIGRVHLADRSGRTALAKAIFVGGLVYVPFCLFEIRMSPFLHKAIYGYHVQQFAQTHRWGGYRPSVFMDHGLMVALWMANATVCGYWLWRSRAVRTVLGIPAGWGVVAVAVTTVACKSFGAIGLLGIGLALAGPLAGPWFVRMLILAIPAYMTTRILGWDAHQLASIADRISSERGGSLRYRLVMEVKLLTKALQRPWLGWGGWSRSRVLDWRGVDRTVTDSTWIIILGQRGLAGLLAFTMTLLPGAAIRVWRRGLRPFMVRNHAAQGALCTVVLLYACDSMVNAMHNPIYALALGSIVGNHGAAARGVVRRARRPGPQTGRGAVVRESSASRARSRDPSARAEESRSR